MMRQALQTIVLLFLIAAVPLQGFAAATKLVCKVSHKNGAAHHVEYLQVQRQHGDDALDRRHAVSHKSIKSQYGHSGHGSCSHCKACYPGAGIVPTFYQSFVPNLAPSGAISFHSPYFYHITPERLERPPVSPSI
jgi:hypothetical protein